MTVIENTVVIHCQPEEAFQRLTDVVHEPEWNPDATAMTPVTDGPMGLGTSYHAQWRHSPALDITVTEYDPPRRWTETVHGPVDATITYNVHAAPDGTRLTSVLSAQPHGLQRLTMPMFARRMRGIEQHRLAALRDSLEQPPGDGRHML
jgi:hypothetical protein